MRAISTVLDVTLCLLFVSAAVGTVVFGPAPVEETDSATPTATTLTSSTATVEYEIRGHNRTAHGTLATLLGRAALVNASLEGTDVAAFDDAFVSAVRQEITAAVPAPNRTQVVALWTPYRGAPIRGTVTVGTEPPPGVEVTAATVSVPVPVAKVKTVSASTPSVYDALGMALAARVTDALLPASRLDASAGTESPAAMASTRRYRAIADALGTSVTEPLANGDIETAHTTLTAALATRFSRDLERRFRTADAANEATRTGTVTLTVRRWQS